MDRENVIKVVESLFEDWIDKNENLHPLTVENMRLLEADVLALLKEQNDCENCAIAIEDRQPVVRCKDCKYGDTVKNVKGEPMIECVLLYDDAWLKEPDWFCADGEKKRSAL